MPEIRGEITIPRPVEEVFGFVSDQTNEPLYNPSMVRAEKISDGPIGQGTRFRSAVRSRGRPTEMLIEITRYDPPTRLMSRTTMKQADIEYELSFESVPGGTHMRWLGRVQPKGGLRVLGPLIRVLGARQEQRIWQSMRRYLETGAD